MFRGKRVVLNGTVSAIALCISSVVSAQTGRIIRGMVVDIRDQPIPSAALVIAGGMPALSDDSGYFRLEIPHRNKLQIDVRRVGYMPSRVGFAPGGDTTISVLMLPAAQNLPEVNVKSTTNRVGGYGDFEERLANRKKGTQTGYFVTEKDIEASPPMRATQVVENTPSIVVRRTQGDRYAIYGKGAGGRECPATVYLDGMIISGGSGIMNVPSVRGRVVAIARDAGESIDAFVSPSEIAGVEIYGRGIFAPRQLQPPGDDNAMKCAIVAYWTKHARR